MLSWVKIKGLDYNNTIQLKPLTLLYGANNSGISKGIASILYVIDTYSAMQRFYKERKNYVYIGGPKNPATLGESLDYIEAKVTEDSDELEISGIELESLSHTVKMASNCQVETLDEWEDSYCINKKLLDKHIEDLDLTQEIDSLDTRLHLLINALSWAQSGDIIIVEHPEVHLDILLQYKLGTLLTLLAESSILINNNIQLIVETCSPIIEQIISEKINDQTSAIQSSYFISNRVLDNRKHDYSI
ncbi:MAG: hypothetical protein GDA48_02830 [Hormoscilla sp. GM102CHS1]|nr:hypothetical protein [Hormoscilla sp. GM102CHS1]